MPDSCGPAPSGSGSAPRRPAPAPVRAAPGPAPSQAAVPEPPVWNTSPLVPDDLAEGDDDIPF